MENIDVSIVLINYKNARMTLDAINSAIEKSFGFTYEILVVDNSNDDTEFELLKNLVGCKAMCINAKANLGFGKGNNLGVSLSKGKYVYFLNNDTLLINNAIYELYTFLESSPKAGIVGSNMYMPNGKPNHSFAPSVVTSKAPLITTSIWMLVRRHFFHRIDFNFSKKPMKVDGYVVGASLMISRANFDKLGGFDKDIFMYYEEALLCFRAIKELGVEIYNVPSSRIIHFDGGSFEGTNKRRETERCNGLTIYLTKAMGKSEAIEYCRNNVKATKKMLRLARALHIKKKKRDLYLINADVYSKKLKELEASTSTN